MHVFVCRLFNIFTVMGKGTCVATYMQGSEDNLWESVLFFSHVYSRTGLRKHLYLLSHLATPTLCSNRDFLSF